MLMPWLDNYIVRSWTVVTIPLEAYRETLKPVLQKCCDLQALAAESGLAEHYWRLGVRKDLFYVDVEQMLGMNMDRLSGGDLYYLTKEFEGHPQGTLTYVTYKGLVENSSLTVGFAE